MKKDIQANLIDKQNNSKQTLSPKAVKILIGAGALVLILVLVIIVKSSGDSQVTPTQEKVEVYSPIKLNYNVKSNAILTYLNKDEKKMKLGFNSTSIKYCVPEDTSNSTIASIWAEISSKTCILGATTATQSECGLVYTLLNTSVSNDSYIQSRYEADTTDKKIYIYYSNMDTNLKDTLKNQTLKALGVREQDFRVNSSDSTEEILESWDSYNLNVLFCPSLVMSTPMALNETTHIHAVNEDVFFQFSPTKIGVKKIQYSLTNVYEGWAWFYAPWNETIVDVFPSQKNPDMMFVHTLTTLYSLHKDYINATVVWQNLPTDVNNTIVELQSGEIILIKSNVDWDEAGFYRQKNVEFSDKDYSMGLSGRTDASRVVAAASGNTVFIIVRGILKGARFDNTNSVSINIYGEDSTEPWLVNTTHILPHILTLAAMVIFS